MGILDFFKRIPSINEIQGSFGEWMCKTYAKTIPGALVLHDVLIDGAEGHTSQMDLVIVSNKGIYVIEVKTFPNAKIYGDKKKQKWYYYNHGKKYEIYSPLMQNKKHVDYLKTFLKDFGELPYFSIITMICDDFKISGDVSPGTVICNSLISMEKAMRHVSKDKPVVIDDDKKQEIFDFIQKNQYVGKDARLVHKQTVAEYKEKLENNDKICPYCKVELVLRNGKNGEFYGCKNFPKCKYTRGV